MLELKAKRLIAERNAMVEENERLQTEMQHLVDEIVNHSSPACIGFPDPTGLMIQLHRASIAAAYQGVAEYEQTYTQFEQPQQPQQPQQPHRSQQTQPSRLTQTENVAGFSLEPPSNNPSTPGEMMDFIIASRTYANEKS